jgi:hypothetical protein
MNYIGDDFSWDKLIIISYPAGYGGDFFCNLLHMNYNPNHTFLPDINNKFEWVVFSNIKSIDQLFYFHKNKFNKNLLIEKINIEKIIGETDDFDIDLYRKNIFLNRIYFYKHIYNEDFFIFKNNYIQYARNLHIKHIEKHLKENKFLKKFITNYHYDRPIQNFSFHEVFPKSKIYFLYAENKENMLLFNILATIKNFDLISEPTNSLRSRILAVTLQPSTIYEIKPFDNMIGIDVGKLFFENNEYENEVEKILSDTLNEKIILNKVLLKQYKQDNLYIIKKMLNIPENIYKMSSKEIVKIILENYFIFDRASIPNDKFKLYMNYWGKFL